MCYLALGRCWQTVITADEVVITSGAYLSFQERLRYGKLHARLGKPSLAILRRVHHAKLPHFV